MPEKEVYGAQPPLELIRQWVDYEFWFDRQSRLQKYVKNMLLIGAMGPPGSGRSTISNRLLSCFSVINLTFPEEAQISNIYMSMLSQHLKSFVGHISNLSKFWLLRYNVMLCRCYDCVDTFFTGDRKRINQHDN